MKIQVTTTKYYEVPDDLESEMRGALECGDVEYVERHLLPAVEHRGAICAEHITIKEAEE